MPVQPNKIPPGQVWRVGCLQTQAYFVSFISLLCLSLFTPRQSFYPKSATRAPGPNTLYARMHLVKDNPVPSTVPYLCTEPHNYDGDWSDYPETQHITLEHIRYREFQKYDPTHLASVLQNWLFFGLLRAILPSDLTIRGLDFVHTDETGTKTVKSLLVPDLLQKWHALEAQLPADRRRTRFEANAKILKEARPLVYDLCSFPDGNSVSVNFFPALPREVALSCAELGEHLTIATLAILDPGGDFEGMDRLSWGNGAFFLERMEAQGWCPFLIAGVERGSSFLLTQYLITIGPPLVRRKHRSCSDYNCTFMRTGIQHAVADCLCQLEEIDISALKRLIERHKTPIIRLSNNVAGPRIIVKEACKSICYVAISHVWTDGLGNPDCNSFPLCQLKRLQNLVDGLYEETGACQDGNADVSQLSSGWFWIDTLCVPNGGRYPELCTMALPRMKDIYDKADKVLVLDSELVACKDTDPRRVLARLWLSTWIRRLWTFQEGYFAKDLLFLVGDSIVSIVTLISDATDGGLPPPLDRIASSPWDGVKSNFRGLFRRSCMIPLYEDSPVVSSGDKGAIVKPLRKAILFIWNMGLWNSLRLTGRYLTCLIYGMRYLEDEEHRREANEGLVAIILEEVSSRASTKTSDEAGCLGLLFNVNTQSIYQIPVVENSDESRMRSATDRMIELFKLLDARGAKLNPPGCIPPGILLLPGPRMDVDGYRWAPRSFMQGFNQPRSLKSHAFRVHSAFPSTDTMLRQSGILSPHGLKIQFPGFRLGKVRADGPLESYFVVHTSKGKAEEMAGGPLPAWRVTYSRDKSDMPWETMAPSATSGVMAIILFSYGPWRPVSEGILVKIRQELDDGSFVVSRVCRTLVAGMPEYDNQDWVKEPWKRVDGDWFPPRQIWCVG